MECHSKKNKKKCASYICTCVRESVCIYECMCECVYFALMAIKSSSQVAFGVCTGCAASLDAPHRAALTVTKKYSWFL